MDMDSNKLRDTRTLKRKRQTAGSIRRRYYCYPYIMYQFRNPIFANPRVYKRHPFNMGIATLIKDYGTEILNAIRENDLNLLRSIVEKQLRSSAKIAKLCVTDIKHRPTKKFACPLILAARLEDPRILKYMVDRGTDPNFVHHTIFSSKRREIVTALHIAVDLAYYDTVEVLMNANADPNIADHNQETPLLIAIKKADRVMVRMLLHKGADPSIPDRRGNAAIHTATLYGHLQIVKTLLKSQADAYQKGQYGLIPSHIAAREGHIHLVQVFCTRDIGNTNIKIPCYQDDREKAPIHLAAEQGHVETLVSLVDQFKADVNMKDSDGNTPLHCVVLNPYDPYRMREKDYFYATAKVLVKYHVSINEKNDFGDSALHLAAMNHFQRIVELLLSLGANPFLENDEGLKPIDITPDTDPVTKQMLKSAMTKPRPPIHASQLSLQRDLDISFNLGNIKQMPAIHERGDVSSGYPNASHSTGFGSHGHDRSMRSTSSMSSVFVDDTRALQEAAKRDQMLKGRERAAREKVEKEQAQRERELAQREAKLREREKAFQQSLLRPKEQTKQASNDVSKKGENSIPVYTQVKKRSKLGKPGARRSSEYLEGEDDNWDETNSFISTNTESTFTQEYVKMGTVPAKRPYPQVPSKKHDVLTGDQIRRQNIKNAGKDGRGQSRTKATQEDESTSESSSEEDSETESSDEEEEEPMSDDKEHIYVNLPKKTDKQTKQGRKTQMEGPVARGDDTKGQRYKASKGGLQSASQGSLSSRVEDGGIQVHSIPGKPGMIEVQYTGGPITIAVDTQQQGHEVKHPSDHKHKPQDDDQPPPLPKRQRQDKASDEIVYMNQEDFLKVIKDKKDRRLNELQQQKKDKDLENQQRNALPVDQTQTMDYSQNEISGIINGTMTMDTTEQDVEQSRVSIGTQSDFVRSTIRDAIVQATNCTIEQMEEHSSEEEEEEEEEEGTLSVSRPAPKARPAKPLHITRAVNSKPDEGENNEISPDFSPNRSPQYKSFSQKLALFQQETDTTSTPQPPKPKPKQRKSLTSTKGGSLSVIPKSPSDSSDSSETDSDAEEGEYIARQDTVRIQKVHSDSSRSNSSSSNTDQESVIARPHAQRVVTVREIQFKRPNEIVQVSEINDQSNQSDVFITEELPPSSEHVGSYEAEPRGGRRAQRELKANSPAALLEHTQGEVFDRSLSPASGSESSGSNKRSKLIGSYAKPYQSFGKIEANTNLLEQAVMDKSDSEEDIPQYALGITHKDQGKKNSRPSNLASSEDDIIDESFDESMELEQYSEDTMQQDEDFDTLSPSDDTSGKPRKPPRPKLRPGTPEKISSKSTMSLQQQLARKQQEKKQQEEKLQEDAKQRKLQEEEEKIRQMLENDERQRIEDEREKQRKIDEENERQQKILEEQERQQKIQDEQEKQRKILEEQERQQKILEEQERQRKILEEQERQQKILEEQEKQRKIQEEQERQRKKLKKQEKQRKILEEQERQQKILEEQERQRQILEEQERQRQILEEQERQRQILEEQERQRQILEEQEKQRNILEEQERQQKIIEEQERQRQILEEQERERKIEQLEMLRKIQEEEQRLREEEQVRMMQEEAERQEKLQLQKDAELLQQQEDLNMLQQMQEHEMMQSKVQTQKSFDDESVSKPSKGKKEKDGKKKKKKKKKVHRAPSDDFGCQIPIPGSEDFDKSGSSEIQKCLPEDSGIMQSQDLEGFIPPPGEDSVNFDDKASLNSLDLEVHPSNEDYGEDNVSRTQTKSKGKRGKGPAGAVAIMTPDQQHQIPIEPCSYGGQEDVNQALQTAGSRMSGGPPPPLPGTAPPQQLPQRPISLEEDLAWEQFNARQGVRTSLPPPPPLPIITDDSEGEDVELAEYLPPPPETLKETGIESDGSINQGSLESNNRGSTRKKKKKPSKNRLDESFASEDDSATKKGKKKKKKRDIDGGVGEAEVVPAELVSEVTETIKPILQHQTSGSESDIQDKEGIEYTVMGAPSGSKLERRETVRRSGRNFPPVPLDLDQQVTIDEGLESSDVNDPRRQYASHKPTKETDIDADLTREDNINQAPGYTEDHGVSRVPSKPSVGDVTVQDEPLPPAHQDTTRGQPSDVQTPEEHVHFVRQMTGRRSHPRMKGQRSLSNTSRPSHAPPDPPMAIPASSTTFEDAAFAAITNNLHSNTSHRGNQQQHPANGQGTEAWSYPQQHDNHGMTRDSHSQGLIDDSQILSDMWKDRKEQEKEMQKLLSYMSSPTDPAVDPDQVSIADSTSSVTEDLDLLPNMQSNKHHQQQQQLPKKPPPPLKPSHLKSKDVEVHPGDSQPAVPSVYRPQPPAITGKKPPYAYPGQQKDTEVVSDLWSQQMGKAEVVDVRGVGRPSDDSTGNFTRKPAMPRKKRGQALRPVPGAQSDSEALVRGRQRGPGKSISFGEQHSEAEAAEYEPPQPKPGQSLHEAALDTITAGLKKQPKAKPRQAVDRSVNYTRGVYRPRPVNWKAPRTVSDSGGRYGDSQLMARNKWNDSNDDIMGQSDGEADVEDEQNTSLMDTPGLTTGVPRKPPMPRNGNRENQRPPISPQQQQHVQMREEAARHRGRKKKRRDKAPRTEPGPVDFNKYGLTAQMWMEQVDKKTVQKSKTMYLSLLSEDKKIPDELKKNLPHESENDDVFIPSQWVIARGRSIRQRKRKMEKQRRFDSMSEGATTSGGESDFETRSSRASSMAGAQLLLFFKVGGNWQDLAWVLFDKIHTDGETLRMIKDIQLKHPANLTEQVQDLMHRWWKKKGSDATIEELQRALEVVHMVYIQEEIPDSRHTSFAYTDTEDDELDISCISDADPDVSRLITAHKVRSLNTSFDVSSAGFEDNPELSTDALIQRLERQSLSKSASLSGSLPMAGDSTTKINRSLIGGRSRESLGKRSSGGSRYSSDNVSVDYESDPERRSFVIVQPQLKSKDFRHETTL